MKKLLLTALVAVQSLITYSVILDPGPMPKTVPAHALTEADIKDQIVQEQKQKQYDAAEEVAARVMKRYGLDDEFAELAGRAAVDERIPARLVAAVMIAESSCNPTLISRTQDVGLMQVNRRIWKMPTAKLLNPALNVKFATHRILAPLVHTYGVREGLHRYNGLGGNGSYSDRVMRIAGYAT